MNSTTNLQLKLTDLRNVRENIRSKEAANATDPTNGVSLLMMACQEGLAEVAQHLIEQGADVNYKDPDLGWTALMFACANRHTAIIRLLVEKGADVNAKHRDGFSPVMFLFLNKGNDEMIEFLAQKGADTKHPVEWLKARGLLS